MSQCVFLEKRFGIERVSCWQFGLRVASLGTMGDCDEHICYVCDEGIIGIIRFYKGKELDCACFNGVKSMDRTAKDQETKEKALCKMYNVVSSNY